MIDGVTPQGGLPYLPDPKRVRQPAGPKPASTDQVPPTPPAEVLAGLERAGAVARELESQNVSLRFEVDEQARRITIDVVDGNGKLLRQIPPGRLGSVLRSGVSALA